MKEEVYVSKDKHVIFNNICLPICLDERMCNRFVPPDLEDCIKYFGSYVKYSGEHTSFVEYMAKLVYVVSRYVKNGYNNNDKKILDELAFYYIGTSFLKQQKRFEV